MGEIVPRIDWYFDFVSPYAYLALKRLSQFGPDVRLRPVLLAGLLDHWGLRGPAEVAPKRRWTYRACQWQAWQDGVPFRFPAGHPFNPLAYLRLSVAAGNEPAAVTAIFDALWTTGVDPADPSLIEELAATLGIDTERLADADVKQTLRDETQAAAQRGVFGVPTLMIDDELFWGADAMDFAAAAIARPELLSDPAMRHLDELPQSARRDA